MGETKMPQSSQAVVSGRAFFTSIPKCGKNVVHCFFGGLGLRPADIDPDSAAARYTHARHLEKLHLTGAPVPASPDLAAIVREIAALEAPFRRFLEALRQLPEGTWTQGHFAFDEDLYGVLIEESIPIVFLHRDPRDCVLSMANFLVLRGEPADFLPKLPERSLDVALRLFLERRQDQLGFDQIFDSYRGWLHAEHVLELRFSDIIGPRGGGDESAQIRWLTALARQIGWRGSAFSLASSILSTFNPQAGTFYKGRIGAWKESFSPAANDLFDQTAGHLVQRWGYDKAVPSPSAPEGWTLQATHELLGRMLQEHRELTEWLTRVANDSHKRLALIQAREVEIERLRAVLEERECDSKARLKLLQTRDGEIERIRGILADVERDSQARLKLLQTRDAEIQELRRSHLADEDANSGD
jgi:hypothetical protein